MEQKLIRTAYAINYISEYLKSKGISNKEIADVCDKLTEFEVNNEVCQLQLLPSLILYQGQAGSGKTKKMVDYSIELALSGKKVLYLSLSEPNPQFVSKYVKKDYKIFVTEEIARKAMKKGFESDTPPRLTAEEICEWLREEKKLDISTVYCDNRKYDLFITDINSTEQLYRRGSIEGYKNALMDGIEHAINII